MYRNSTIASCCSVLNSEEEIGSLKSSGQKVGLLGSNSFCPGFRDKPITIGLHGLHRAKHTTCVIISYACLSNILFIINLIGNGIIDFVDNFS